MMLGHLSELKDAERKIRIQIDTIWKQLIEMPSPIDADMKYVERIDPIRLKVNVSDICRKLNELQGVLKEIVHARSELGIEAQD